MVEYRREMVYFAMVTPLKLSRKGHWSGWVGKTELEW